MDLRSSEPSIHSLDCCFFACLSQYTIAALRRVTRSTSVQRSSLLLVHSLTSKALGWTTVNPSSLFTDHEVSREFDHRVHASVIYGTYSYS